MRPRPFTILVLVAAAAGLFFAAFSTYDFVAHLDRQVHSLHCSFIPGIAATDATGSTGCHVTMMSPYSSVFRKAVWGGIPISIPAMAVFAFLLFWCIDLVVNRRQEDRRATAFLVLSTLVPVGASIVMAVISFVTLGAACKLCIGIYVSSGIAFIGALGVWRGAVSAAREAGVSSARLAVRSSAPPAASAPSARDDVPAAAAATRSDAGAWDWNAGAGGTAPRSAGPFDATIASSPGLLESARRAEAIDDPEELSFGALAGAAGIGLLFVILPVLIYLALMPDFTGYVAGCGRLDKPADAYGVMVPLDTHPLPGAEPAIEVLDPLCPACKAFEERLVASGLDTRLERRAALFPLDNTCNWMVSSAVHPGACTVSEAMLCAGAKAGDVLEWAFANQDQIRAATATDPGAAARMVGERFPDLAKCVGSAGAKSKLNKALRWAVSNRLPVLTPQLYVNGAKLCDEDTDLGMDYALSRLIDAPAVPTPTGATAGPDFTATSADPVAPTARPAPASAAPAATAAPTAGPATAVPAATAAPETAAPAEPAATAAPATATEPETGEGAP